MTEKLISLQASTRHAFASPRILLANPLCRARVLRTLAQTLTDEVKQ